VKIASITNFSNSPNDVINQLQFFEFYNRSSGKFEQYLLKASEDLEIFDIQALPKNSGTKLPFGTELSNGIVDIDVSGSIGKIVAVSSNGSRYVFD
jgi:hypothetical protein